MVGKDFESEELVWAQMKGYPPWPARITDPKGKAKKDCHYVYFFGTENFSWISDEKIFPHSDEMIENGRKRKLNSLQDAIEIIIAESKKSPPPKKKVCVEEVSKPIKAKLDAFDKLKRSKSIKIKDSITKKYKKKFLNLKRDNKLHTPLTGSTVKTSYCGDFSYHLENSYTKKKDFLTDKSDLTKVSLGDKKADTLGKSYLSACVFPKQGEHERPKSPPLDVEEIKSSLRVKDVKPTNKKIGFLGIEGLARGMVKNLLNSKHQVTVWDNNKLLCEPFVKAGAKVGLTISDVVESSDIIFSYARDAKAAKENVFCKYGVLVGLDKYPENKGYVELGSMDDASVEEIAKEIYVKRAKYLEAPVNGTRSQAIDGQLLVLASGDQELFTACQSCFHAISRSAHFVSSHIGCANKMNTILNMFDGTVIAALAEALALVKSSKLSCETFLDIMKSKSVHSALIEDKGQAMLQSKYSWETMIQNQQNDMNLALSLASFVNLPLLVSKGAYESYKRAKYQYFSEYDVSAVIEAVRIDDGKKSTS